jgi:hypothetical protein
VGLLAGDDQCRWSAWFRAHFQHQKVEREGGDLVKWKKDHAEMVDAIAHALAADGWDVTLEGQNKFNITGRSGIELAGQPDIVAVRGTVAKIVDAKGGKERDKDWWQVALYMVMLPIAYPKFKGLRILGEVHYTHRIVQILPEEIAANIAEKIAAQVREAGGDVPPAKVPSYRECRFCNIGKGDCPERVEQPEGMAVTDLF